MTLREATASADTAFLAALAGATPLGSLLWRAVYGGHEPSAARVIEALCEIAVERYGWAPTAQLWLLAGRALREWSEPRCPDAWCGGRGGFTLFHRWIECPHCRGTGLRRYSNRERRAKLGEWSRPMEVKLYVLLGILTDVDTATARVVGQRLRPLTGPASLRHHPPADARLADSVARQPAHA